MTPVSTRRGGRASPISGPLRHKSSMNKQQEDQQTLTQCQSAHQIEFSEGSCSFSSHSQGRFMLVTLRVHQEVHNETPETVFRDV